MGDVEKAVLTVTVLVAPVYDVIYLIKPAPKPPSIYNVLPI